MREFLEQLTGEVRRWALDGQAQGWLDAEHVARLEALETRSPATLFDADLHRPLVVAFFGGTGVGKSTLLNRLAGEDIARTGIERPTSREVSVYLHESTRIRQLPAGFPLDRVRCAYHRDERRRQVLWIDMPDIDSTEIGNRDLVMDWLPHIDVLVYVVSPERYRDDKGWRLLQRHCRDHAWLFVMNQWDLGDPLQQRDFLKLLSQGGFADPLLLCTDCRRLGAADDFERLQETIQSLADEHVIQQLEARALQQRLDDIRQLVSSCLEDLGSERAFENLRAFWSDTWDEARRTLLRGLAWPLQETARAFVRHEASPLLKRLKLDSDGDSKAQPDKPAAPSLLWDDWAQMQLQDALDRLLLEAGAAGVPRSPLRAALQEPARKARGRVLSEAQKSLRLALANPGNILQRVLLKTTGFCAILLPLSAIGWVSYDVVTAYYQSALTHSGYLGTDFAIHGGLLIAIAWLLPFTLHRVLKPSAERTALKGLRQGVEAALASVDVQVASAVEAVEASCQAYRDQGRKLLNTATPPESLPQAAAHALLDRMLPRRRTG
jgi:GTPase SAR1 family protein